MDDVMFVRRRQRQWRSLCLKCLGPAGARSAEQSIAVYNASFWVNLTQVSAGALRQVSYHAPHAPLALQPGADSLCPHDTIRYDTRCYVNVQSKADMSQLNLPYATNN